MRKQPFQIVLVSSLTFNDDSCVKQTRTQNTVLFFLTLQIEPKLEIVLFNDSIVLLRIDNWWGFSSFSFSLFSLFFFLFIGTHFTGS